MIQRIVRLLGALVVFLSSIPAFSAEVLLGKLSFDQGQRIASVVWDKDPATTEPHVRRCRLKHLSTTANMSEEEDYCVELRGKYSGSKERLLMHARNVTFDRQGRFLVEYQIRKTVNQYTINTATYSGAKSQEQKIYVVVPKWDAFMRAIAARKLAKKNLNIARYGLGKNQNRRIASTSNGSLSVLLSLGASYMSYGQTGLTPLTEWGLTFRAAGEYRFSGQWVARLGGEYTQALQSSLLDSMVSNFAGDGVLGYEWGGSGSSWRYLLGVGWSYSTSFTTGTFGFHNLMGPELFFRINKSFNQDQSGFLFLKAVSLTSAIPVSIGNGIFGAGIGYNITPNWGFTLDASILKVSIPPAVSELSMGTLSTHFKF